MSTLESFIQGKAVDMALDELGVISVKLSTPGQTGFPDTIFFLPFGQPLFVEFKRPGEAPRPKQTHIHRQLVLLGYDVCVFDDADACVNAIMDRLKERGISCQRKRNKK